MNWLLLVVLIIIGGLTYRGYKKGLIQMVLSFGVIICSVIITGILGPAISKGLCESEIVLKYVAEKVNEGFEIEENLNEFTEQAVDKLKNDKKNQINNTEQTKFIEGLNLPNVLTDAVMESTADAIETTGKVTAYKFAIVISECIAKIIIRGITYIVVFILARVVLQIFVQVFRIIEKIPGIEDASELAGGCVGACSGLFIIWVSFLVLLAFSSTNFGMECYRCINESSILSFLYNNNLLLKWVLHATTGV